MADGASPAAAPSAPGSPTTDLPPPGTALTGGGGILPPPSRSQVAPRTVVTVLLTTLLFAAALFLLWQLSSIVQWLVIALFLAVALHPLVDKLTGFRLPRPLAVLASYLVLVLVVGGVGALVVPPLVDQVGGLVDHLQAQASQPGGVTSALQAAADRYGLGGYVATLREQTGSLPARAAAATGPLLSVTRGVIGSLTATASILLISFFLLMDGERFVAAALALFHPAQRPRLRRLLGQSAGAVHGYVNGNLLISLAAGVATFVAMSLLGLPYAVALALVVALFDLVPLVGSLFGAAIAVTVALFVDPTKAAILLVFFLIYQQIENNVLQPLVYGRSVSLHPLVIFLAVLAGGQLLGILGALLAIPAAEIVRILTAEWLAERARKTGGTPHGADTELPIERVAHDAIGHAA